MSKSRFPKNDSTGTNINSGSSILGIFKFKKDNTTTIVTNPLHKIEQPLKETSCRKETIYYGNEASESSDYEYTPRNSYSRT